MRFSAFFRKILKIHAGSRYYGLFFSDCIKIFRIESKDIKENRRGGLIYYSDFQHKGNVGEGQFHINPRALQIHLDNYLHKTLAYEELLQLLTCET